MHKLTLTLACLDYDRTRPLLDGSIEPEGIELIGVVCPPNETFYRMLRFREFDISEMSLSNYAALVARGDRSFVGVPVFPSRTFRHSCIFIHTGSGVERPEDLAGKRIGQPSYEMTAAVYARGLLQHEYGVQPDSVHWFQGRLEATGDRLRQPSEPPAGIRLDWISPGETLSAMLEAGALDALITTDLPSPFLRGSPMVRRLFPNFKQVEQDYFRGTGIFPIMHTIVIRAEVYERNPWIARSLYKAFSAARDHAYREAYEAGALTLTLPWLIDAVEETRAVMGNDYWPYGIASSRPTLEALTQYLVDQGLAPRRVAVEELFAPNTLDL
jgi:4,5-dihydroxyphthalate decarboxylase